MTSTPASINDESLNGSWIDINSASQIHSPIDNDSQEFLRPPHSLAESVQNLGIISFQVERFLQEAQKQGHFENGNSNNENQIGVDNISDMYLSDSDLSSDGKQGRRVLIDNLRKHSQQHWLANDSGDNNDNYLSRMSPEMLSERLSKNGECLLDQVSDSLSILSRASFMAENGLRNHFDFNIQDEQYQDYDWLWDWTAQPEYFAGQEWKICNPRQREFLLKHQRGFGTGFTSNQHNGDKIFSGEMMSLLFLTNILSIIIGAGLTYSILMRRPTA